MANERHSYIEFYMSDWQGGMKNLTPMQEWIILQVSLYNWENLEPVPEKKLALILQKHPDWQKDLDFLIDVAEKLYRTRGGGVFKDRALASGKKAYDLWAKRSKGGRATAGKPKSKQSVAQESVKSAGANQNQNQNQNQTLSKDKGENGDLIFSVDPEIWEEWVDYRKRIKKPMSERTEKRILKDLELWHGHGHDPGAILLKSIDNGWVGIFEPKGAGNGNGNSNNGNGLIDACTE